MKKIKYKFAKILSILSPIFIVDKIKYRLKDTTSLKQLYTSGKNRPEYFFVKKILEKNDFYINVGANIGELSLIASEKVGCDGKIIALEPHPKIFQYLIDNIKINKIKNIVALNCAASNKTGSGLLTSMRSDEMNHLIENLITDQKSVNVEIIKLDSLIEKFDLKKCKLIAIDAEGHEVEILKGADLLLDFVEFVLIEITMINRKSIFEILENKGFEIGILYMNDHDKVRPVDDIRFNDCWDYVAYKKNKKTELLDRINN